MINPGPTTETEARITKLSLPFQSWNLKIEDKWRASILELGQDRNI